MTKGDIMKKELKKTHLTRPERIALAVGLSATTTMVVISLIAGGAV